MRSDYIAPVLTGRAKNSFNAESQFSTMHPLDAVLSPTMHIREYIRRGQKFGLLSTDVEAAHLSIRTHEPSSVPEVYDMVALLMKMPKDVDIKGSAPQKLFIYKNTETGVYYFGIQENGVFQKRTPAMNNIEVGQAIVDWAQKFADKNKCKQHAFLKTFAGPTMDDPMNLIETIKAGWTKLSSYIQGTPDDRNPAPRV